MTNPCIMESVNPCFYPTHCGADIEGTQYERTTTGSGFGRTTVTARVCPDMVRIAADAGYNSVGCGSRRETTGTPDSRRSRSGPSRDRSRCHRCRGHWLQPGGKPDPLHHQIIALGGEVAPKLPDRQLRARPRGDETSLRRPVYSCGRAGMRRARIWRSPRSKPSMTPSTW